MLYKSNKLLFQMLERTPYGLNTYIDHLYISYTQKIHTIGQYIV